MKKNIFSLLLCFFLLFSILLTTTACLKPQDSTITTELDSCWEFKQVDSLQWREATVPGNIHSDLLQHHLLSDPYYGDNEYQVQWVGDAGWEYRCRFDLTPALLKKNRVELIFRGLDTYATVYLNGRFLFRADNMFRTWIKDIKAFVRPGENVLFIRFDPVSPIEQHKQTTLGYALPGGSRVHTRKAGFHYGWDWGPRLLTCGIWRPVELRAWRTAKIEDLHIIQEELLEDIARLSAVFEIESLTPYEQVTLQIEDTQKEVRLQKGTHTYKVEFEIQKPKRWWPNGWGEQQLYHLRGDLIIGCDTVDSVYERIGLRTIELVQESDSLGRSFYFEVNGSPLFIKGSNYIPQDNLQNRVDRARYEKLIRAAADANMNMLRVWGGGIYEEDTFYDLCDEHGLLVWQDFMFACAMYPGDSAFLDNVTQEAIDNLKRLRNHPSIALWCGNNESSEGWHRWGWQDNLTTGQISAVWDSYRSLFQSQLPSIIDSLAPNGIYWETSPKYGRGDPRHQFEGDAHYWGVWHDAEPFEVFEQKVPRFMSEFGFQSLPDVRTIEQFASQDDKHIDSQVMKTHQKHPRGYQLIDEYMKRNYQRPKDFENYIYVSQILQSDGITRGIEAHRRARPYCMGTLFWQLNDCWPAVSWSGIDCYGRWKALHYAARRAYQDIIVSVYEEEEALNIMIISDKLTDTPADIVITLMDFHGNELFRYKLDHTIRANSSQLVNRIDKSTVAKHDLKNAVLLVYAEKNDQLLDEAIVIFDKPKNLILPRPNIVCRLERIPAGYEIILQTDVLAKNVYLRSDVDGFFADNYFDLVPGREKTIFFKTEKSLRKEGLKIMSLANSHEYPRDDR
jgi:beta-mannosidase